MNDVINIKHSKKKTRYSQTMGRFSKMVRNEKTKISKIYERIERLVSLSVFFIPISLDHFDRVVVQISLEKLH